MEQASLLTSADLAIKSSNLIGNFTMILSPVIKGSLQNFQTKKETQMTVSGMTRVRLIKKTIRVKDIHIRRGLQGDPHSCPIALALREILSPEVKVNVSGIIKIWNGIFYEFDSPHIVKTFIFKFDQKKSSVKPMRFGLYLPYEYLRK